MMVFANAQPSGNPAVYCEDLAKVLGTDRAESGSAKEGSSRKAKQREAEVLGVHRMPLPIGGSKEPASNIGPGTRFGSTSASNGTASRARPMPTDACRADAIVMMALAAIMATNGKPSSSTVPSELSAPNALVNDASSECVRST